MRATAKVADATADDGAADESSESNGARAEAIADDGRADENNGECR